LFGTEIFTNGLCRGLLRIIPRQGRVMRIYSVWANAKMIAGELLRNLSVAFSFAKQKLTGKT